MSETEITIPKLLDPKQAARVLGLTPHTLAVWRSEKRYELPFVKVGNRVRYRAADIHAFIDSNTSVHV